MLGADSLAAHREIFSPPRQPRLTRRPGRKVEHARSGDGGLLGGRRGRAGGVWRLDHPQNHPATTLRSPRGARRRTTRPSSLSPALHGHSPPQGARAAMRIGTMRGSEAGRRHTLGALANSIAGHGWRDSNSHGRAPRALPMVLDAILTSPRRLLTHP